MIKPRELLRSRETCPSLPEEIHKVAECIFKRTKDMRSISPQELAIAFAAVLEEKLFDHFELFPQLVDAMVREHAKGDNYSTVFRKICRDVIGINTPYIIETKEYPKNIQVAVDWWTNAVLFRRDTENMPTDFKKVFRRQYTPEEVALFKSTLAREIMKNFAIEKNGVLLSSEWTADEILERAGNKIGVNSLIGYPDAAMAIYENEVKVSVDGGHTWESIFYTE